MNHGGHWEHGEFQKKTIIEPLSARSRRQKAYRGTEKTKSLRQNALDFMLPTSDRFVFSL
jgi:hypothetical protein